MPKVDQNTVIHLGVYHVFACRTTYTNNMPLTSVCYECSTSQLEVPKASISHDRNGTTTKMS